jgi:hypothetical protein
VVAGTTRRGGGWTGVDVTRSLGREHAFNEGAVMKYALLVYGVPSSWHSLSTEQKHALHGEYHAVAASPGVMGHYRVRSPQMTTTVRVEEEQIVKTKGPLADAGENFRAFYLVESDDHDSVLELAARIPAARMGGAVEIWPLTER